jgi:uncharacterized protein YehS (DUF1456 family)
MNNNDILIRLRYALDIKNTDMIEIFRLGEVEVSKEDLEKILTKSMDIYNFDTHREDGSVIEEVEASNNDDDAYEDIEKNEQHIECTNHMLESFLNGFIIFKRGKKESKPGEKPRQILTLKAGKSSNNVMLKKLKIALNLTSDDMLDIFDKAGVSVSKSELSAFFRKEGHKHYRSCLDKYARSFLNGLTVVYRKEKE